MSFNYFNWQSSYYPLGSQCHASQFSLSQPAAHGVRPSSSTPTTPVNVFDSSQPSNSQQAQSTSPVLLSPSTAVPTGTDFCLKVINPENKKDCQVYTVRNLSGDIDSPARLKKSLSEQYGDLLPPVEDMEIGYFHQTKKMWIRSRLDLNDMCNLMVCWSGYNTEEGGEEVIRIKWI